MSWMKYVFCVLRLRITKNEIQREACSKDLMKCGVGNLSLVKYEMALSILKISCYEYSQILPHKNPSNSKWGQLQSCL